MNLNNEQMIPGKLTAVDFANPNPKGLDYQGRYATRDGDVPWPLLDSRKPWQRPAMTGIDIACLLAVWCAGAAVIGLAVFGLVTLIKLLPGV